MFNYFKRSTIASSAEIHSDNNKDNKGYWSKEMEATFVFPAPRGLLQSVPQQPAPRYMIRQEPVG